MAVNLSIFTGDITQVLASFDVMRVERSVTDEVGPYTELTAAVAQAATLLGSVAGSFNVVGKTIEIKVDNNATVLVTFTGTDPLTTTQVIDQINTALGASIATDESGQVRLTSTVTGTASKMQVVSGTSLVDFGFTAGDRDIGEEPYTTLVAGTEVYPFTDNDGQAGYFYRAWFFNTTNNQESPKSAPFEGVPGTQVTSGQLSLATVDLVDLTGTALANRKVSLYPVAQSLIVEGFGVDFARAGITIETDNSGHAETNLIRGSRVKVVFEGTNYIRTIDVPDQSTFDLLSAVAAVDDEFSKAVILNLPAAPRRTL